MPYFGPRSLVNERVQTWIGELEAELGRPIRVLSGNMLQGSISPWSNEQAMECGVPLESAQERGLTIIHGGSLHDVQYVRLDDVPWHDVYEDSWYGTTIWDVLAPIDEGTLAQPWTIRNHTDTEDLLVGEITERTLLTYYQWMQWHDTMDLDKVIKEPLLASIGGEQLAEFLAARDEHNRSRFVEYASRSTNAGIAQVRGQIANLMRQETLRREQLAVTMRELRNNQRQLDSMLAARGESDEDVTARLARAWDALHEDERVHSLTFSASSDQLIIDTEPLNLVHPHDGREVYLGRFRVVVSINDSTCRIHNQDNARGGHDHPHVSQGNPCFGEMGTTIYELIQVGDLPAAIEMIFVFLTSVNLDDEWGRTAAYWFEDDREPALAMEAA